MRCFRPLEAAEDSDDAAAHLLHDHALRDEARAEARRVGGPGPDRLQPAVDGGPRAGDPRAGLRPGARRPGSRRRHHQGDDRAARDLRSRGGRRHDAERQRLLRNRRAPRRQGDALRDDCGRLDAAAVRHRPDAPGALPAARGVRRRRHSRADPKHPRRERAASRPGSIACLRFPPGIPEHRSSAGLVVSAQPRGAIGLPGGRARRTQPAEPCLQHESHRAARSVLPARAVPYRPSWRWSCCISFATARRGKRRWNSSTTCRRSSNSRRW